MTAMTTEWVFKAEGYFGVALRERRGRKSPNYDASCFHSQQAAEKYIKAVPQELSTPFAKTHDLLKLIALLPPDPFWATLNARLFNLTAYAVNSRYPGKFAGKAEARESVMVCREVRDRCRHLLNLPAIQ